MQTKGKEGKSESKEKLHPIYSSEANVEANCQLVYRL